MSGRWEYAPKSLVKNLENFQETLESIHIFMKEAASATWKSRFLRKTSIEAALAQYHERLNDAAQSFQISTLIEIHYAMNAGIQGIDGSRDLEFQASSEPISIPTPLAIQSQAGMLAVMPPAPDRKSHITVEHDTDDSIWSVGVLEDQGFRRYHQSEVVLRGRSRLDDGWWSGASEAQVNGQTSLIKRYEGPSTHARKQWVRDVKVLQRLHHPNLPQMLGYSMDTVSTPFILLSNVQTRSPESFLIASLRHQGVAPCIENMLRFYSDIVDATFYVQEQMSLSDQEAQDFLESSSFRIDGSESIIVGLPILNPSTKTWRSYPLNDSLRRAVLYVSSNCPESMASVEHFLQMLPNRGIVQYNQDSVLVEQDPTWQLTQLTALVASLLPSGSEPPGLPVQVKKILSAKDESYGPQAQTLSLRQLRLLSIEANGHDYVWRKNSSIPAHKFSVGDIGYIPPGKDWDAFVKLGNILKEGLAGFTVRGEASGVQWCWKDVPIRHSDLQSFDLPDSKCWPVAVPPGAQIDCQIIHRNALTRMEDAWEFLLNNAVLLGKKWTVPPESIILITQEGTDQCFAINDFGGGLQLKLRNTLPAPRGPPQFFPHQSALPRIMYLSTSDRVGYEPCWSHTPVPSPHSTLERGWTFRIQWKTGFINWAQLHPEDFN